MNEPLGEYGGVVLRRCVLFGDELPVGYVLSPEVLGEVSERHRRAITGAGLVRYYSSSEGAEAGFTSKPPSVKKTVKTGSPPNTKKKGGRKSSNSSKKRATK